jgi:hypothetical protein
MIVQILLTLLFFILTLIFIDYKLKDIKREVLLSKRWVLETQQLSKEISDDLKVLKIIEKSKTITKDLTQSSYTIT